MEPNEEMRLKIKKLVILLKKMRERDSDLTFMSDNDKAMLQGLDFIIKNFENVDIHIDSSLNNMIPPQFQNMIDPLIKMLTEELGEDFDSSISNELSEFSEPTLLQQPATTLPKAPSTDDILATIDDTIPAKHRIMMAIQQVDEMLKNTTAGSPLADELLDRRIDLLQQLKNIS
ncbi:MAG: hypothetical protein PHR53_09215 [Bacteroidales bacterium]|nr:hypothetical protein [Bacteroidales bacterium]